MWHGEKKKERKKETFWNVCIILVVQLQSCVQLCNSILDTIKNTHISWEEVKISTLTQVWKKLIPTLMDNVEEVKTSVEVVMW